MLYTPAEPDGSRPRPPRRPLSSGAGTPARVSAALAHGCAVTSGRLMWLLWSTRRSHRSFCPPQCPQSHVHTECHHGDLHRLPLSSANAWVPFLPRVGGFGDLPNWAAWAAILPGPLKAVDGILRGRMATGGLEQRNKLIRCLCVSVHVCACVCACVHADK